MSTTGWVVLGVVVVLVLWVIMIYNQLVAMRQRVGQAFADVDVQLKLRHDLIPNLVETVKGYASHERGTLEAVVNARNAAITAQGPAQQAAAENMLTRRAAPTVRAVGGLPGPKGEPELPAIADRDRRRREQDRGGAALLQQRGVRVQRRYPAVPRRAVRGVARVPRARVLRRRRRGTPAARQAAAGQVLGGFPPAVGARHGGRLRSLLAHPVEQAALDRAAARPVLPRLCDGVRRRAGRRGAVLQRVAGLAHSRRVARSDPRPALGDRRHHHLGADRLPLPPVADRFRHRRARGDAQGRAAALQSPREPLHLPRHPDAQAQGDGRAPRSTPSPAASTRSNIRSP